MSREHPIMFSAPLVRAILEDRKMQTRRVIKPQPEHKQVHDYKGERVYEGESRMWCWNHATFENLWDFPNNEDRRELATFCPYGVPGDRLWVRETWGVNTPRLIAPCVNYRAGGQLPLIGHVSPDTWSITGNRHEVNDADLLAIKDGWRPSIFMPRWASRITLEITEVRVQKLNELSETDALAEGIPDLRVSPEYYSAPIPSSPKYKSIHVNEYARLWDSINAKRGYPWSSNPFVWAISFRRVQP